MLLLLAACAAPPLDTAPAPTAREVGVTVTLDGAPAAGVTLAQGGRPERWATDAEGRARVVVDEVPGGERYVIATHPEARTGHAEADADAVTIELFRYDPRDNEAYTFLDSGTPERRGTTNQCAHCHTTLADDWWASPHRASASNPVVRALDVPGGGCADCHAPMMDGPLGGRELALAEGLALEQGVGCDVCHKVDRVDLAAPAGVAGRLVLTRPSEPRAGPGVGDWEPLFFGPYDDVANLIMGAVVRDHFHDGTLCAGCHELWQAPTARWPDGLPVHTTFSEWQQGPMAEAAPCNSCHMPPAPEVGNAIDLGNVLPGEPGYVGGWLRPPGEVRHHSFDGPRGGDLLALAATLEIEVQAGDPVVVTATVGNSGPGHALPTGEPLRSIVLRVEAWCGSEPLPATGGDAIPWFGGAKAARAPGDAWPEAAPGDVVRVVRRVGWRDDAGWGPFGDGTFSAEQKGIPRDEVVGEAVVLEDGTLDRPLVDGDLAFLGDASLVAGAPGAAFARVLADADGDTMVPHAAAVDLVADNRLLPGAERSSVHRFAACDAPSVRAWLVHRALPPGLGFDVREQVMAEVRRD